MNKHYYMMDLVSKHISKLPTSLQEAMSCLRQIVLSVDSEILEYIKWNSLAFYYVGQIKDFKPKEYKRDLMVVHLNKNRIMSVFLTGMYFKKHEKILERNYTDGRRLIHFKDANDIVLKEKQLKSVIKEWLELIEK